MRVVLRTVLVVLVMSGTVIWLAMTVGERIEAEVEIGYQVWQVRAYTHYIHDLRRDFHLTLGGTRCFDALPYVAILYRPAEVWLNQVHYDHSHEALTELRC